MFYIHQSNLVEVLAEKLSAVVASVEDSNPFAGEVVLVQSPGMSQWLKIFLAERLGVMANVDFPLPSSFIWKLYQRGFDDLPEKSAFNKQDMSWKLYDILPDFLDQDDFSPLKAYLAEDKDGLMLYQLSEKIADVFDQYLMYRPDWIAAWEAGEDDIDGGDIALHPWQSQLWRALKQYTESLGQAGWHRVNLHQRLLDRLDHGAGDILNGLPSRIFIFGISALPYQQLQIFEAMAAKIDIHLMLFNPCCHYWGDIVDQKHLARVEARFKGKLHFPPGEGNYLTVGNPLLASWGKLGRDYLEQLLDIAADQHDLFIDPQGDGVLATIQSDIYSLSYRGQMEPLTPEQTISSIYGRKPIIEKDSSLVFHSCHSPMREVEVLHDQLLAMFDSDASLQPKDIIVMMPDVAAYSPYIDAVFGGTGQLRVPYAISDRAVAQENPIINSFLQLMRLPQSRFCSSELLDLISVPATCEALGLGEQDIDLVRHWIEQVGIRWGIDAEHKGSFDLPEDDLNSWRFGLNRLLLGYAMGSELMVNGILPYTEVEGQSAEVLGKLVRFMDLLIDFRTRLGEPQSINEKVDIVNELIDVFYLPQPQELSILALIREALNALREHEQNGNCRKPVSQSVFAYWLSRAFNEKGVGQRFLAGQVNFCTLMPMRSIPFKVICLLGMNDADYPRFVAPVGFDLMTTGVARKGDRSRRLDDRYLLLEALLSARQRLYISYVGRSMQDNSEKIPSVLVSELLDYCAQRFVGGEARCWVTEHPLQPFNPAYFSALSDLRSYQAHWYRFLAGDCERVLPDNQAAIDLLDTVSEIEFTQLLRFMLHPVRYFFNHTLQLYFGDINATELNDEVFSLDGLERYRLLQDLTVSRLLEDGLDDFGQFSASGRLPHRAVGQLAFDELKSQASGFVETLKMCDLRWQAPYEIQLTVGDKTLLGWVKNLTGEGLLFYRPAKITAKDKLTAWCHHVILCAQGHGVKTRHIGLNERLLFKPLEASQARALVEGWLQLYESGQRKPLPFFVKSSEQWARTAKMSEVAKVFNGSSFNQIPGEGDDPYIQLVYRDIDSLPDTFAELAERVFQPMMDVEVAE